MLLGLINDNRVITVFLARTFPCVIVLVFGVIGLSCVNVVWAQADKELIQTEPELQPNSESVQNSEDQAVADLNSDSQRKPSSVTRRPVWEFGVGGGYFSGFDYPASNDENQRFVALPFFIYRTPVFRFGGGGVRAVAIERPRVKLDLSIGGSLNASSDGDGVREGLPPLDFLFEIGPQLEVRLFDRTMPAGGRLQGRFTSELRAVFATDFSQVSSQGLVAEVGLGVNYGNVRGSGVDLITAIDITFADEKLQDYFYEVSSEFATENRAAFDARGGYLETNLFAGIGIRPLRNVRVFTGFFVGLFDGARNQDSPLFETTTQTGFALGIVWTIKTSDTFVDIVDLGSTS